MADSLESCYMNGVKQGSIIVDLVLGFNADAFSGTPADVQQAIESGAPNVNLVAQGLTALTVNQNGFAVVGELKLFRGQ